MSAFAKLAVAQTPDWLAAEMPPGYQNRLAEIQRLSADLYGMERFGRLLWEIGEPLNEAVSDVFATLKYDVEPDPAGPPQITVRLDPRRRLLVNVSEIDGTVLKKNADLAQVFQMLHQVAGENDRVVLVANSDRGTHPADRPEPITADALSFLRRMGANFVTAPTLFKLWMLSLEDQPRARTYVDRLHEQDGGAFVFPSSRT
jgi:hypothetical protein